MRIIRVATGFVTNSSSSSMGVVWNKRLSAAEAAAAVRAALADSPPAVRRAAADYIGTIADYQAAAPAERTALAARVGVYMDISNPSPRKTWVTNRDSATCTAGPATCVRNPLFAPGPDGPAFGGNEVVRALHEASERGALPFRVVDPRYY